MRPPYWPRCAQFDPCVGEWTGLYWRKKIRHLLKELQRCARRLEFARTSIQREISSIASKSDTLSAWRLSDDGLTLIAPSGVGVELTVIESAILRLLLDQAGEFICVTRAELTAAIINVYQAEISVRAVKDALTRHIVRLRQKGSCHGLDIPIHPVGRLSYVFA